MSTAPLLDQAQPATVATAALVPAAAPPPAEMVLMFERLAKDPAVDPEKLERLIALQERILQHNARAAFEAAFAAMQPNIPEIAEKGQIRVRGELRSTYARLEDIHAVIKPILQRHGFALRHRTEWPADKKGIIRIVGILSHLEGHSEESAFEAPMDQSDFRTDIQSMGSTVSYGRRYTTLDLLNISTRGQDDDGGKSGRPQPPEGYQDWFDDLTATADDGMKTLEAAWSKSKPDYKTFTVQYNKASWEGLKKKAAGVAAS